MGSVLKVKHLNFIAGISSADFEYRAVSTQNCENWCWAACIQMVLSYQGLRIDQPAIATRAFGQSICEPAGCDITSSAANGWNIQGKTIRAFSTGVSAAQLIDDLAYRYPIIVGLNIPGQNIGHAYVLTAIYFQYDSNNRPVPYKIVLRDPWPTNPSRKEITWSDFVNRYNCIVHVTY